LEIYNIGIDKKAIVKKVENRRIRNKSFGSKNITDIKQDTKNSNQK
jgi:phage pi2 protein 07